MMFDATIDHIQSNRVMRYSLTRDAAALRFADVLDLWQSDAKFRRYYTDLLANSPFEAFRWETPPLTSENASQPFQFVLLNSPEFCSRRTDDKTYRNYFSTDDTDCGVISFANLSADATLIVPSPRTDIAAYGHLAASIRRGPSPQLDAFWRVVSTTVKWLMSNRPLWLSTAGGGVAWLHVRIDSNPKYYGYAPFKIV